MNNSSKSSSEGNGQYFHLDEHTIMDCLLGLMSPSQEQKTIAHLLECPSCEKLFQERSAEIERFHATRILRSTPERKFYVEKRGTAAQSGAKESSRHQDVKEYIRDSIWARFRRPHIQLAGALVVAIIVAVVIVWPQFLGTPPPADLYVLRPYSFQLQQREIPGTAPNEDLKAGLEAYDKKEFEQAIELLEKAPIPEHTAHETIRQIYLGSALAWKGEYEEAVAVLDEVPFALVPGEWGKEAQWTLYVSLRESGHQASADSLLHVLSVKSGEVGERARRHLQLENNN
jgi:tetratricopeptide (TPR) repeat protein